VVALTSKHVVALSGECVAASVGERAVASTSELSLLRRGHGPRDAQTHLVACHQRVSAARATTAPLSSASYALRGVPVIAADCGVALGEPARSSNRP
jgi:hypothetical protein